MSLNLIFLAVGAFSGTFFYKYLYKKYKFYNLIIPFFILIILTRVNLYDIYTYGLIYGFGIFIGFCSEANSGTGYFVDCIFIVLSSIVFYYFKCF